MKKRLTLISLTIALVMATLMPASALAKPAFFIASGVITSVAPGIYYPAGNSGRWRVADRQVTGTFLTGDITGDFTLDYNANVLLLNETGNLHGTLSIANGYVLNMKGKTNPIEVLEWQLVTLPDGTSYYMPLIAQSSFSGKCTFQSGANGGADLTAWVKLQFDPYGEISGIIESAFTLTGQWKP